VLTPHLEGVARQPYNYLQWCGSTGVRYANVRFLDFKLLNSLCTDVKEATAATLTVHLHQFGWDRLQYCLQRQAQQSASASTAEQLPAAEQLAQQAAPSGSAGQGTASTRVHGPYTALLAVKQSKRSNSFRIRADMQPAWAQHLQDKYRLVLQERVRSS
jgi:hypothetical protein